LSTESPTQLIKELIDAGIHFGHRASRWNPKMKPYIYGKRNDLHIIDVKQTLRGLLLAKKFIAQTVADGKDLVLVGTKRQARKSVQSHGDRVEMHWVNDRWLGGTLTNFREIRKRVGRLIELEAMDAEGTMNAFSKKEGSRLRREMRKIQRNLGGIRNMERMPGVMVVIDATREHIAVREAAKCGVPVIGLIDTDTDPDPINIPIPGNDDAMRAIEIIIRELCDAAASGVGQRTEGRDKEETGAQARRSRRPTTARAAEEAKAAEAAPAASEGEMVSEPAMPAEAAPAASETESTEN
jgi:small subunit ribosomal protein S2